MRIRDFNAPAEPRTIEPPAKPEMMQIAEHVPPVDAGQPELEIAMLKAQIEHLELVVETARTLMSSNQEKLLRRLHDLPREMVALSARLHRLRDDAPVRRVA